MPQKHVSLFKIACIVLCLFALGWAAVTSTWVTNAQLARLHNGMTRAEVISVLGQPINPNDHVLQYWAWCKRTDPIDVFFDKNDLLIDVR